MGRKSNIEKEEKAAEQYAPMDFDEITRRLRNGADIQTLADLHGWGYTKMVSRLQYLEKKHGRQLLTPEIMHPSHRKMYLAMKKAEEKRKTEPPENLKELLTTSSKDWPEKKKDIPEEKPEIPEEVYITNERCLMPETVREIELQLYRCLEMSDKYKKQAEDWQKIKDTFLSSFAAAKFPEVKDL